MVHRLHDKYIVEVSGYRLFASALVGITAREVRPARKRPDDAAVAVFVVVDQHKVADRREDSFIIIELLPLQLSIALAVVGHDPEPTLVYGGYTRGRADHIVIDLIIKSVIFDIQCMFLQIQLFYIVVCYLC